MRSGWVADDGLDRRAAQADVHRHGRPVGGVLDRVVEQVAQDLVQPLTVGGDGRDIVRHVERQPQRPRGRARLDDLELLLELGAEVDAGDVDRYRTGLDAREVEQLLRHAQNALGLLVDDRRGVRALGFGAQAAVDQRLAEADEARQRRLQLVRHVREKLALDLPRSLHRFRHPVER